MKGKTLRQLSLDAGLSGGACSLALSAPWPKAERAIARFLGFAPDQIWPDRYINGKSTRGRPPRGRARPVAA